MRKIVTALAFLFLLTGCIGKPSINSSSSSSSSTSASYSGSSSENSSNTTTLDLIGTDPSTRKDETTRKPGGTEKTTKSDKRNSSSSTTKGTQYNVSNLKTPYYKDGDRVVFIGDSITWTGLYLKDIYAFCVTRYPNERVCFLNRGIAGDTLTRAFNRFEMDIMSESANKACLMFGMNDYNQTYYYMQNPDSNTLDLRKRAIAQFKNNMNTMISKLSNRKINSLTFLVSSIMDETTVIDSKPVFTFGYNDALASSKDQLQTLINGSDRKLVNFNQVMFDANKELHITDPKSTVVSGDRIHPGELGSWIMAYCFFKDLGFESDVARVNIDYKNNKITSLKNCELKNLTKGNKSINFSYRAYSLPLPATDDYLKADKLVSLTESFNNEIITVSNLPNGNYTILINNKELGTYSSNSLSKGVNIALSTNNPNQIISKDIYNYILAQKNISEIILRNIAEIEINLKKSGISLNDQAGITNKINKWKNGSDNWMKNLAITYETQKPNQQQIVNSIKNYVDRAYNSSNNTVHHSVVIKAK